MESILVFRIAWDLSKESFFKLPYISHLKFRATYGVSGNVDQSKSAVTVMAYSNNSLINLQQGIIQQYPNPELSWEKVSQINLAIEFISKKETISGSMEYYRKKGLNLFGPAIFDYTAGITSNTIIKNVANMQSNGVDLVLMSKNINKEFKWSTNFLFSYNTSITTKYYIPAGSGSGSFVNDGSSITPKPGEPLYSMISYKWAGLEHATGNPQGYLDKAISTDYYAISADTSLKNITYNGSATPKIFGSLINTFSWKKISLTAAIQYKLKYFFRRNSISYDQLINYGTGNSDYSKRWQKPGDEKITNVPSMVYPNDSYRDAFYLLSETTVSKADQIRLQYVMLSYDFSLKQFRGLPFQLVQLYLNAANLGILWRANKDHIDPDYPSSVANPKTFTIGIRSNF